MSDIKSVEDSLDLMLNEAIDASRDPETGECSYAYAFGWFTTDVSILLKEMKLSNKQKKIMYDRIKGRTKS